jgi:hypothetical protein
MRVMSQVCNCPLAYSRIAPAQESLDFDRRRSLRRGFNHVHLRGHSTRVAPRLRNRWGWGIRALPQVRVSGRFCGVFPGIRQIDLMDIITYIN